MNKITKTKFIAQLCEKTNIKTEMATQMYEAFVELLIENMLNGDEVILMNFGALYLTPRPGHKVRKGMNTGNIVEFEIGDHLVGKFVTADGFNAALREREKEGLLKQILSDKNRRK